MSSPAFIIATVKVRPSTDRQFTTWKADHDRVLGKFPGFVSSDIIPPTLPGGHQWTIIVNFRSREDAEAWQQSPERAQILAAGTPFFEEGNLSEVIQMGAGGEYPTGDVTEVIFSKIKPGREDSYREWAARMQAEQAKYPGYKGTFLQPPDQPDGFWTTIMRFDSAAHLEAWMQAPERQTMLAESKNFIEHEQLTQLATSFPGWVPIDIATGQGPPDWKTSLLVLLGLFPIVMLQMRFLNPPLAQLGLPTALAIFLGNVASVLAISFLTMPLFVRWFRWWLFPSEHVKATSMRGMGILLLLFTLEIIILWRLLP